MKLFFPAVNFLARCDNLTGVAIMPVTPEQIYEQVLIVRCQLGDDVAFRELFLLHEKRLSAFNKRLGPPGL